MLDRTRIDQRRKLRRNIAAEDFPTRKNMTIRRHRRIIAKQTVAIEKPALKMPVIARNQRHPRRRHVDAMHRLIGIIGKPATKDRPRLENNHPRRTRRNLPDKMIGKRRPRKAAPDDRDHRRR